MLGCSRRLVDSLFVVGLAFGLSSCASNNEGKIVGIWETTEGEMVGKFKATLPKSTDPNAIVSAVFVFKAEGDFTFGYRVGSEYASIMTGKYKLGAGDAVELFDIKVTKANAEAAGQSEMAVKAVVNDTTMALTDKAGTTTYQRRALVKAPPTAPTTAK
jgi:hypothetical protein